jgi:penicillin-binding protein 1C
MKERRQDERKRHRILMVATALLFVTGGFFLWVASLRIPALEDISERKITQSTKIYDRTGEILLYDVSKGKRTNLIPLDQIAKNAQLATIAIEDKGFYEHKGFKFSSFMRAVLINLSTLSYSQGGSTITQQVVKNSILTGDKTPTRKLKEIILASKLEGVYTKDEILNLYLNEIPYGGTIYGIGEASASFFGKPASDLTLAESAYLAAIPKAPTYYSPYGSHRQDLEDRKNQVLKEMLDSGFISQEEHDSAKEEVVVFKPRSQGSIKAPHFVFYVVDYLAKKYGEDAVQNSGFKVITTLDYEIQSKAEEIAKKYGEINKETFKGGNNALVAVDPKTGDILAMVGSRDYFDTEIEGNFNAAIAHRQPGSSFKPIVYAELFNKGFTPASVLFDVRTQFSTACAVDNYTSSGNCYSPENYNARYQGPVSIRAALGQSINVVAVKALYIAGLNNVLALAKNMGIEGLDEPDRYGLTLVLGGGEVSLLDMAGAYGVFANDGLRAPSNPVLRIMDSGGEVVDVHTSYPTRVLPADTARAMSDVLKDNVARIPLYGANSSLYVPGRDVAVKTGTTNDYRDAWIVGYTPNVVLGAWVGNNDNTPMERKVSGLIVAPMWRELLNTILAKLPNESFPPPPPIDPNLKPILRGEWRGGNVMSTNEGEYVSGGVHSILYWIDKNDPTGPIPSNPERDSQFRSWEYGVRRWAQASGLGDSNIFIPRTNTPEPQFPQDEQPFPSPDPSPQPSPVPPPGTPQPFPTPDFY